MKLLHHSHIRSQTHHQHAASHHKLGKVAILACTALVAGSLILYHINSRQQPHTQQQQAAADEPSPGQHPSAQRLISRLHSRITTTDCNSSRVMRRRQDDAALPAAALLSNDPAQEMRWQRLQFDATAAIPLQLLWQTSRSSQLSAKAAAAQATWLTLNPGLNLTMQNDSAAAGFIHDFYGPAVSTVYRSFPLGVMRSDFWRYAVSSPLADHDTTTGYFCMWAALYVCSASRSCDMHVGFSLAYCAAGSVT